MDAAEGAGPGDHLGDERVGDIRGVVESRSSVVARETSATTPKKRRVSPWMVTKRPTAISSTEDVAVSLMSTPLVKEPLTTIPRRRVAPSDGSKGSPPRGSVPLFYDEARLGEAVGVLKG